MKTKEFIKRVGELGYYVMEGEISYYIRNLDNEVIASINKLITFQIRTEYDGWDKISSEIKKGLFDIISKYASTPPDERKEEKKYFYEHRFIKTKGGNPTYLSVRQRQNTNYFILQGSCKDVFEYKVEFTDKEMEETRKQDWISLDDFVKKEIVEE